MRRSRRSRMLGSAMNLDSLVDVVTNTNGMLILLAVFTTLHAVDKTYTVTFPVTRPTAKAPVYFECQGNRIFPIEQSRGYSEYYYTTAIGSSTMVTVKSVDLGETSRQILEPGSVFERTAQAIDPESGYAAFLVRPDSFEVFRTARGVLSAMGIEVGWEPKEAGVPIIFGPSGRSVKPQ